MGLWVDNRHHIYDMERERRHFTRDQFTGDALMVSIAEAAEMTDPALAGRNEASQQPLITEKDFPGLRNISRVRLFGGKHSRRNGTYLKRRALGESADAFRERASITRFPSHMPTLIEAYIGGIASVEVEWEREWGEPLGEASEPGSLAFKMWHNIDGTGRNWQSAHNRLGINMIVDDFVWTYTELSSADYPRTHIIDPDRVVDWHDEDGIPVWVLMYESRLERPDFHAPGEVVDYYTEFDTEGWARWRVVPRGEERALELVEREEWRFPIWTDGDMVQRRLPFSRFRLSDIMGRYVGFQMAQDHNMLYNLLSDARWNFRVINHPRLKLKDGDEESFLTALKHLAEGANGLLGDWDFISPNPENGAKAYHVLLEEVKQFYITNHQRVNTSTIERSATEVSYNEAAGRTSFLSILTDALDELENDHLFLASQLAAPNAPDTWHNSRVVRSRSFRPVDIHQLAAQQATSIAALAKVLDVETAMRVARDGVTDETMDIVSSLGADSIMTEEL